MSLLILRVKRPDLHRPFKVPFNIRLFGYEFPITTLLGAVSTLAVWLLVVVTKPEGRTLGFIWLGLGISMYLAYRKTQKIPVLSQVHIKKIKIPAFKQQKITHILLPIKGDVNYSALQMAGTVAKQHGAKLTVVHIIEVPFSLPLDAPLPLRVEKATSVILAVETYLDDLHVKADGQVVRSRSATEAILDILGKNKFDLLLLPTKDKETSNIGQVIETLFKKAPCHVWVIK
jgi:APA family basic amino acid/polyamine antiporter